MAEVPFIWARFLRLAASDLPSKCCLGPMMLLVLFVFSQLNYTMDTSSVPFLLPTLLNFQGTTHLSGVGSFSNQISNWCRLINKNTV